MVADRGQEVLAVAIFFFVLTWITVGLRVYVRAGMLKHFGLDDWTMLATLILFTVYLVCQIGGVAHGTGKHSWDVGEEDRVKALRFWYFCELFYIMSSCLLKVALGIFLLRVAVRKMHIWIIHFLMVGTCVFGAGYLFLIMFQCHPISDFWNVHPNSKNCVPTKAIVGTSYTASALMAFVDWTFGTLPIFIVWDLNMHVKTKCIVAGILAFAAIGSTATIVRIPYVKGLASGDDFLWNTTDIAIWSTVEPGIGITAGCMATLRPLFQTVLFRMGLASTAPASAALPNSKKGPNRSSNFGYFKQNGDSDLRPYQGRTITSVTGPERTERSWRSRSSSEERIFMGSMNAGINKSVIVEHTSEARGS